MKTHEQWLNYKELELISSEQPEPETNKLTIGSVLNGVKQFLLAELTNSSGLRIWLSKDQFGNTRWNIHNSATGLSTQLTSESEVRVWLDEYYSQKRVCKVPSVSLHYRHIF